VANGTRTYLGNAIADLRRISQAQPQCHDLPRVFVSTLVPASAAPIPCAHTEWSLPSEKCSHRGVSTDSHKCCGDPCSPVDSHSNCWDFSIGRDSISGRPTHAPSIAKTNLARFTPEVVVIGSSSWFNHAVSERLPRVALAVVHGRHRCWQWKPPKGEVVLVGPTWCVDHQGKYDRQCTAVRLG
jgi:hypothetical protein